jgi:hypothetical protein
MEKLGVDRWCFHDRDIAPDGKTLAVWFYLNGLAILEIIPQVASGNLELVNWEFDYGLLTGVCDYVCNTRNLISLVLQLVYTYPD